MPLPHQRIFLVFLFTSIFLNSHCSQITGKKDTEPVNSGDDNPVGSDAGTITARTCTGWQKVHDAVLSAQDYVRMVYHPIKKATYVVSSRPNQGIFSWNGEYFQRVTESFTKAYKQSAAFDPQSGNIYIVGGIMADHMGAEVARTTWIFDGKEVRELTNAKTPSHEMYLTWNSELSRIIAVSINPYQKNTLALYHLENEIWIKDLDLASENYTLKITDVLWDQNTHQVYIFSGERVNDGHAEVLVVQNGTLSSIDLGTEMAFSDIRATWNTECSCANILSQGKVYKLIDDTLTLIADDQDDDVARKNADFVYDETNHQFLTYAKGNTIFSFNNAAWKKTTIPLPISRHSASIDYDPNTKDILMYGGYNNAYLPEFWRWNGRKWEDTNYGTENLSGEEKVLIDTGRNTVMLFGDVIFEQVNGIWTRMFENSLQDGLTSAMAIFHLDLAQTIILANSGTYSWDGKELIKIEGTQPSFARDSAMAYDFNTKSIVRFGGYSNGDSGSEINETWEFDGTNWNQIIPNGSPGAMGGHSMIFDHNRNAILLIGGYYNSTVWEYKDKTWLKVGDGDQTLSENHPDSSFPSGITWDDERKRTVFYPSDGTLWEFCYNDTTKTESERNAGTSLK